MLRIAALVSVLALAVAALPPAQAAPVAAPVISGAQTKGGEGGIVFTVDTLIDGGPGSLRKALDKPGPRIIKFAVAGVIKLKKPLRIANPRVTIAGETAPSPGITLQGGPVRIWASDVIMRHIRVRVGDGPGYDPDDRDGITILGVTDKDPEAEPARNVLIENCSVSWAIDEVVSTWFGGVEGVTVRNSIIAEGLNNSLHPKGAHSMGLLIGNGTKNVLVQGNLLAHNRWRNPVLTAGVTAAVLNNLIYDPGDTAVHFYDNGAEPTLAVVIGNVVKPGPSTRRVIDMFGEKGAVPGSRIYLRDNDSGGTGAFEGRWRGTKPPLSQVVAQPPLTLAPGIKVQAAASTQDSVLKNVGARPWNRDATDRRIIDEVMKGGGQIRDTVPPGEMH